MAHLPLHLRHTSALDDDVAFRIFRRVEQRVCTFGYLDEHGRVDLAVGKPAFPYLGGHELPRLTTSRELDLDAGPRRRRVHDERADRAADVEHHRSLTAGRQRMKMGVAHVLASCNAGMS